MFRTFSIGRMPIFWGTLLFLGFYALVDQGLLSGDFIQRYFAAHPVEYITTALFFLGMAALGIKATWLASQKTALGKITLGPIPAAGQEADDATRLLEGLARLPRRCQTSYLARRLHEALDSVHRRGSADTLVDHLRHLAEVDVERVYASYALVRIVIWAVPILGFLGTVIGITLAIAKLAPESLEQSLPEVTNGLGVAFDTTALALGLSIILMFTKFYVERKDFGLLDAVDRRATEELVGRFQQAGTESDPNVASVRRMAEHVIASTEVLVDRQAELWHSTVDSAQQQWNQWSSSAGRQIEKALAGALTEGLRDHADAMARAEASLAEENRRHLNQLAGCLEHSVKAVVQLQSELVRQGDMLRQIIGATAQLKQLESALNENLSALAGSKNFEDTVMSLAAAIQLLSTRLGHPERPHVRLPANDSTSSAA
ncbi:MAG: MotA/TolQ/ExbB proton channel family protein [Planctomycetia bacterium]|nr:MAG: MotA/TolQ/ExbB proton channel family protein [Planctomycetia bacterium]